MKIFISTLFAALMTAGIIGLCREQNRQAGEVRALNALGKAGSAAGSGAGPAVVPMAAQLDREMPYDPFRKVGNRFYDLRPLYQWIDPARERSMQRPMPDWLIANGDSLDDYHVAQVFPDGLLVTRTTRAYRADYGDFASRSYTYFLTNFPYLNQIVDDQRLFFFALRTGGTRYSDPQGIVHTIELYDYGVPYDPNKLAASRSRTNSSGR